MEETGTTPQGQSMEVEIKLETKQYAIVAGVVFASVCLAIYGMQKFT